MGSWCYISLYLRSKLQCLNCPNSFLPFQTCSISYDKIISYKWTKFYIYKFVIEVLWFYSGSYCSNWLCIMIKIIFTINIFWGKKKEKEYSMFTELACNKPKAQLRHWLRLYFMSQMLPYFFISVGNLQNKTSFFSVIKTNDWQVGTH